MVSLGREIVCEKGHFAKMGITLIVGRALQVMRCRYHISLYIVYIGYITLVLGILRACPHALTPASARISVQDTVPSASLVAAQ